MKHYAAWRADALRTAVARMETGLTQLLFGVVSTLEFATTML